MKSKKMIVLMWVLALLPAAAIALLWSRLPAKVPVQWGFDGAVRYDEKSTLWLIAGLSVFCALLFQFLPRLDPRRKNYEKFQGFYDIFGVGIQLFLAIMVGVLLSEALAPGHIDVGKVTGAMVGILFLLLGNMMGKVKSNFFMGFRTPWALSDPDVWNKTQRMGGFVFFLSGLYALLGAFFLPEIIFFWGLMLLLLGGTVLTCVMSYLWYRKKHREDGEH